MEKYFYYSALTPMGKTQSKKWELGVWTRQANSGGKQNLHHYLGVGWEGSTQVKRWIVSLNVCSPGLGIFLEIEQRSLWQKGNHADFAVMTYRVDQTRTAHFSLQNREETKTQEKSDTHFPYSVIQTARRKSSSINRSDFFIQQNGHTGQKGWETLLLFVRIL